MVVARKFMVEAHCQHQSSLAQLAIAQIVTSAKFSALLSRSRLLLVFCTCDTVSGSILSAIAKPPHHVSSSTSTVESELYWHEVSAISYIMRYIFHMVWSHDRHHQCSRPTVWGTHVSKIKIRVVCSCQSNYNLVMQQLTLMQLQQNHTTSNNDSTCT